MKKLLIIFCILFCLSCRRNFLTPPYKILIHYIDKNGVDIFSTTNNGNNGYWMDSIRLYDFTNGTKTLLVYNSTTFPYYYDWESFSGLDLNIQGPPNIINNYTNTLIQLKPSVTDTLKVQLSNNSVNANIVSVWYNGVQHKEWPILITK